ncbi:MAG: hypothetical protein KF858_04055 [Candidatus Sumerlaeia bacterium]|nr:hypothetical protein [Candidatus Sumerlaeia bacterium]
MNSLAPLRRALVRLVAVMAALLPTTGCMVLRPREIVSPLTPPPNIIAPDYESPVIPPLGFIFTKVAAPLDFEFPSPGTSTRQGSDPGLKQGESNTHFIRIPFVRFRPSVAWERISVAETARAANIQTLHYADYEILIVLGIYAEYRLRVYGE